MNIRTEVDQECEEHISFQRIYRWGGGGRSLIKTVYFLSISETTQLVSANLIGKFLTKIPAGSQGMAFSHHKWLWPPCVPCLRQCGRVESEIGNKKMAHLYSFDGNILSQTTVESLSWVISIEWFTRSTPTVPFPSHSTPLHSLTSVFPTVMEMKNGSRSLIHPQGLLPSNRLIRTKFVFKV